MRIERWYWLAAFCAASFVVHLGVAYASRTLGIGSLQATRPPEVAISMLAPPAPKPKPPAPIKPKPPVPKPTPKPQPERVVHVTPKVVRPVRVRPVRVATPRVVRVARALPRVERRAMPTVTAPRRIASVRPAADPGILAGAARALANENPIINVKPGLMRGAPAAKLSRTSTSAAVPTMMGGSEAPSVVLGGHGGAPGPEAPPEDVVFTGGGAGGLNLPKLAPRIGGGGGASILSVDNPLAGETVADSAPGLGPGHGGGLGTGSGGGAGFGHGPGIGTHLKGLVAMGSLNRAPGDGIGAGHGSGIGTRSPGGGHGTGSELPGTGGSGAGYGNRTGNGIRGGMKVARLGETDNPLATVVPKNDRPGTGPVSRGGQGGRNPFAGQNGVPGTGHGVGTSGPGSGVGIGLGNHGTGRGKGGIESPGIGSGDFGTGKNNSDHAPVVRRVETAVAVPQRIADRLHPPPPRGSVFGAKPTRGTVRDTYRIVYVIDVSDSMNEFGKMNKARAALKKALSELESRDRFDVVAFDSNVHVLSDTLMSPSSGNVALAGSFIDGIDTSFGTNMGGALQRALSISGVSHVYLITDGEPTVGVRSPNKLRQLASDANSNYAQIISVALGVGVHARGSELLRGLADDSGGTTTYVDLRK